MTLNSGSGGATLATDDVGGIQYQRVKPAFGADGAATDVSSANPLPTDPSDRAARDLGKVDVALLDQYTPIDVDTGAGTDNALPVAIRLPASGGGVTAPGDAANGLDVDVTRLPALAAGTNNIGDVDVLSVPADPFGANADAASASGSISAKLREIATNGVPLKAGAAAVGTVGVTSISAGANRIGKVTVRNAADAADIDPVAETTFTSRIGEVQANPTANTVLARLRDLLTGIVLATGSAIIGRVGIDQTTDGTTNKVAATQATAANLNAQVQGAAAADAAVAGNPVLAGGRASNALPTAVSADGDAVSAWLDRSGRQVVDPIGPDRTLKTASINCGTSGDNTIVAAVSSKVIKVYAIVLNVTGTVNVKWKDGASTDLTGDMNFQAREGYTLSVPPPAYLLKSSVNTALVLNLSAAVAVDGWISYWDADGS